MLTQSVNKAQLLRNEISYIHVKLEQTTLEVVRLLDPSYRPPDPVAPSLDVRGGAGDRKEEADEEKKDETQVSIPTLVRERRGSDVLKVCI